MKRTDGVFFPYIPRIDNSNPVAEEEAILQRLEQHRHWPCPSSSLRSLASTLAWVFGWSVMQERQAFEPSCLRSHWTFRIYSSPPSVLGQISGVGAGLDRDFCWRWGSWRVLEGLGGSFGGDHTMFSVLDSRLVGELQAG